MKKVIFTCTILFTFFALAAQIDREIVILEGGTGVNCPYCPGSAMALLDFYDAGDPVAAIEYHNYQTSQFNTSESGPRCSYYAIGGYPTMQFDGEWAEHEGGSQTQSMYSTYLPKVTQRMTMQTAFAVEISGSNVGDNYNIKVHVEKVGEYANSTLTVQLVLTESEIPYYWIGMSTVDFCQRIMVPDVYGTQITLDNVGDDVDVELSFTFNDSWDINTCELIAFVQDESNKEVLHGDAKMITNLAPPEPTFVAGFYSEETGFCATPAVGYFHSDCIGDPVTWSWTFEGGIPETSLVENPVITYLDEGSYNVQLIISDGVEWDTLLLEKYIHVDGIPDVSWNEVPELCNEDWSPYELTEGQPYGGLYSGDYVFDGMYFDPQGLDAGQYPVTYTYMNEAGCENSEDYNIEVVNCVGIGEKEVVSMELYPNPTTGLIYLTLSADKFNNANIRVIDAVGKEVYREGGLNVNGTFEISIDLSSQPQGIYFVTVSGENQRVSQKIFVRH